MELNKYIDHTMLKAYAQEKDIIKLCDEADKYKFKSVCINPCYVSLVKSYLEKLKSTVKICTVVGFPLGQNTIETKTFEAQNAINTGAEEIDMVINIGALLDKKFEYIEKEISDIRKICEGKILKVIIETCYLTDEEKKIACELAVKAGTDYVKTSTGFGTGGSTPADIKLMRETVGENIGVKASGGVRCEEDAVKVIDAGATRIGASASIAIVSGDNSSKSDY